MSVTAFGATGDGVTDDTAAIQAAFDSLTPELSFPAGDYLIDPDTGIFPKSGQHCYGPGRIVFATSSEASYNGVKLESVSNVTWEVDIYGDAETHVGDGSQQCPCMRIDGSSNITVYCAIDQATADGILIHNGSSNVTVRGSTANTGRQGVAIVDCDNFLCEDFEATDCANGGVHFEPGPSDTVTGNLIVRRVTTRRCAHGISTTDDANDGAVDPVVVEDSQTLDSTNENQGGLYFKGGVVTVRRCVSSGGAGHGLNAFIMDSLNVEDSQFNDNDLYGVRCYEDPGHSATYAFEDCSASGNTSGGATYTNITPTLTNCTGLDG